ncbi:MAG TPA: DUF427 domain-containing protein [Acidimicrobiales bacterium]|nr:DUF427 domain-containing protein [Acidimicrobiales bacterium]
MSLTTGRGPLGPRPAGRFSAPIPSDIVYVEPFKRRVRGLKQGQCVIDSERSLLVHRAGMPPTYAFPAEDVNGIAAEPEHEAPGYVNVPWDAVDRWYEEDERVSGHPRNPYHRVDCLRTSRRLRVSLGGVELVDTTETVGVYETALDPRLYVKAEHARMDLLDASTTTTYCPYKGTASYWNANIGDSVVRDVAWSYEDPLAECAAIRGLLSFDEKVVSVVHDLPS